MDYDDEVRQKYGETDAYKECINKTKNYTKEDYDVINKEARDIYLEFAENMKNSITPKKSSDLVIKWKNHISKYFYNCTDEILAGLGKMYIEDDRFKKNIDSISEGLAEYISRAIEEYINN